MTIEKKFGCVLRKIRKNKKISQDELALTSWLDRTFISQLECGKKQPSLVTIIQLARSLNVSTSYIMSEVDKLLSPEDYTNLSTPEGCEVCVDSLDGHILLNVKCDSNDHAKLAYIMHSVIHNSRNDNIDKILVNLNMDEDLRILDLNYLISGKIYLNNTKVAYVYNKLADYVNSDMIKIMKRDTNCNLFNNVNSAKKWLLNE